jgi:FKBP-type peptidyl-prolyl cis-trans isomerase
MLLWAVLASCADNAPRMRTMPPQPAPEIAAMEAVNQHLTEKDKDIIEAFIRRKNWTMLHYPDGYYAMLLKEGQGMAVKEGSQVELRCTIRLLNGTLCYAPHNRHIVIGRTNDIAGLHTALLNLKEGAEARFVFPPHLAYGLTGDRNKIPPRVILLFEVELLNVS